MAKKKLVEAPVETPVETKKKSSKKAASLVATVNDVTVDGNILVKGSVSMEEPIKVQVQKLKADAKIPEKKEDDAGWDIYTNERKRIPGQSKYPISTGIALAIPFGWVGKIRNRSSVAVNTTLMVDAGVIDPGYRGEIKIVLANIGEYPVDLEKGQKIAQILFEPIPNVTMTSVKELPPSERGAAGFGSTGK